jgi:hypothetical protein
MAIAVHRNYLNQFLSWGYVEGTHGGQDRLWMPDLE